MRLGRVGLGAALVLAATAVAGAQSRDIGVEGMRSEKRVALVVGNAAYPSSPLRNPVNDARAMAQTLRALGFEVLARENAGEKDLKRAIEEFGDRLRGGGVGLFFYAGHGIQVGGRNYLVPVDAQIRTERDVEIEALDVARVLARMDEARNRLNIVVLDACRDNPFGRSFRSSARGLAAIDAPSGTWIAYATAPGRLASDGDGANGLYTGELVRAMREPGVRLEDVFKRVRQAVRTKTKGEQIPWEASSVEGDFFFALPRTAAATPVPAPAPPAPEITKEVVREYGTLAIRGRLAGIEVWLDERKIGATETGTALVLNNLAVGTYRVTARKAGHKDWEREVQVAANQRAEILIDIEPLRQEPPATLKTEDGAAMVLVPAGEFWMGSDPAEVERLAQECRKTGQSEDNCRKWGAREAPRHRVYLDEFYIDRYEVTNALFGRFVSATGHRTTAEHEGSGSAWQKKDGKWQWVQVSGATWRAPSGSGSSAGSDHPVVQVSWDDADAYCRWAGKRLPTEAEWEKAARGTGGRRYPWGEDWDPSKANGAMAVKTTRPVGSYPGGVSPYGAHDMAGNAFEWVADWLDEDYYKRSPERNPTGPSSGQYRVLRGGSWRDIVAFSLRTSFRLNLTPGFRGSYFGFRCARGLP